MSEDMKISVMQIVRTSLKATRTPKMSKRKRDRLYREAAEHLNAMIAAQSFASWQFAAAPRAMHDCEIFGIGIVYSDPLS